MSRLFRQMSMQSTVDQFDRLRAEAKKQKLTLSVRRFGTRMVSVFMFELRAAGRRSVTSSDDLDEIELALREGRAE